MITSLKRYFLKSATFTVLIMLSLSFTGCLKDDPITPVDITHVVLYHGSPNTGGLDVYLNDNKISSGSFDFGEYSRYLSFSPGELTFTFSIFSTASEVAEVTATFEKDKFYSVFVADELADADAVVIPDVAKEHVTTMAQLRVINLSPDMERIDMVIGSASTPFAADLLFKTASDFQYVTPGKFDLKILDPDNQDVLATLANADLTAGLYYTLIVRGYRTPPTGNTNVLKAQLELN